MADIMDGPYLCESCGKSALRYPLLGGGHAWFCAICARRAFGGEVNPVGQPPVDHFEHIGSGGLRKGKGPHA